MCKSKRCFKQKASFLMRKSGAHALLWHLHMRISIRFPSCHIRLQERLCAKARTLCSLSLSLSLTHTHTHTQQMCSEVSRQIRSTLLCLKFRAPRRRTGCAKYITQQHSHTLLTQYMLCDIASRQAHSHYRMRVHASDARMKKKTGTTCSTSHSRRTRDGKAVKTLSMFQRVCHAFYETDASE